MQENNQPLVTIGIPTYNRNSLLKRSLEAALNQDYKNIEVIVSDNASTDDTEKTCLYYSQKDSRCKYIRQKINIGVTANFIEVLKNASGELFMWLGDDDWIDVNYISVCVHELCADSSMALVSGIPKYYRNGQFDFVGKPFNLSYSCAWSRVIAFYTLVQDNGMFYGVMRTHQVRKVSIKNMMGGDWLFVAGMVFMGKAKTLSGISVHRELGGATVSYRKIAESLGLSVFQATFPMSSIALSAWMDILNKRNVYQSERNCMKILTGGVVFALIVSKPAVKILKHFRKYLISWCWS